MESGLIGEIRIEDIEFIKFIYHIFKENDKEKIDQLLDSSLDLLNKVLAEESIKNKKSLEWFFLDLLVETIAHDLGFPKAGLLVSYDLTRKNKGKLEKIKDILNEIIQNKNLLNKGKLLFALNSNIEALYISIDTNKIQKKSFDLFFGTNMMTV